MLYLGFAGFHRYLMVPVAISVTGIVTAGIGVLLPPHRGVLLLLGGTGLFIGLVSFLVVTGRTVSATIARGVYRATTKNVETLVEELGGRREYVYVPGTGSGNTARLLLSYSANGREESVSNVRLHPTGSVLYWEFENTLTEGVSSDPDVLAEQLADGLLNQFEIVRRVVLEAVSSDGVTVGMEDTVFGPETTFDHPVVSFFGVGLANGLEKPVVVTDVEAPDGPLDYVVTYRWSKDENDL